MANAVRAVTASSLAAGLQRQATAHILAFALGLAAAAALLGEASGHAVRTGALALGAFLPFALIVPARIAAYHPHPRFGLPNVITTARAAMTCLFAAGLVQAGPQAPAALAWGLALLAAFALALDGLDGWLARKLGLSSPFGARYDMEVDALLILLLSIAAWRFGKAGLWVILSGLLRYGFVAAGLVWPKLMAPLPPSFRRKLVCVAQTAALCLLATPLLHPPASVFVAAAALALLAWSFAVDLAWLLRRRELEPRA